MESFKTNTEKNNFLVKTWRRCRSFPRSRSRSVAHLAKSNSWNGVEEKKKIPVGSFPVYVGPDKQRIAVKTKYVNHPLFSTLLEDAVAEYGYRCDGPILLPCEVDLFYKVMAEVEAKDVHALGWSFEYRSCSPFNPSRRLGNDGADQMCKGYGSYEGLSKIGA